MSRRDFHELQLKPYFLTEEYLKQLFQWAHRMVKRIVVMHGVHPHGSMTFERNWSDRGEVVHGINSSIPLSSFIRILDEACRGARFADENLHARTAGAMEIQAGLHRNDHLDRSGRLSAFLRNRN